MSKRQEEIRRIVAELDAQVAQVEASLAVLKDLVAEDDDEVPEGKTSVIPPAGSH